MNNIKTMLLMVTLTVMLVLIGGAQIAGNPKYLSNALRKVERAVHQIPMTANPATSQMFIVNPLSGGGLTRLFSTHPPMEERIRRLESMNLI